MDSVVQFRRRLDTLLEGIQVIDYGWRYIYLNDVMVQQARANKADLIGHTMMDKYPGIEETEMFGYLQKCMTERTAFRIENQFAYPDGTARWFDLRIEPDPEGICVLSLDITDYKEAQEKVAANEKRFRALIEKSADMKTMATSDGRLIYGSPSITKILGYTLDEMQDKVIFDLFHPDDKTEFLAGRKKILATPNDTFNFQLRARHKEGHWVWCAGSVTNLLEEPGINAIVSNFTDISEKKAAEQRHEFDRNNLYALINNSIDLLWSVDLDFKLITSNKPYDNAFRMARGHDINKGNDVLEGSQPLIREWLMSNYRRAFLGEVFTETVLNADRWYEVSFHPIRKENEVIGTACHAREVTHQRNMDDNLKRIIREISDYKYALDESSIVAITDQKGIIRHVNDNFCAISKYTRDELIGQDHRIINSGYHPKSYIKDLWTTIARGKIWRGELRNQAKDGSAYWVDTTIVPFLGENRKPYQYIAIRSDITQRKMVEEELVRNNVALQKTNLELDRFVYSISHDLRSPLTSILGVLSLMEDETRETETLDHIRMIRSGINRLDVFIKNILSYSRNNRTGIFVEPIPLVETTNDVIDALCSMKDAAGIHFEVDIQEHAPFHSDRQSFVTVLENLISNAIKFHRREISDKFIRVSGIVDDHELTIQIEDNGIGIAPEYHDKIFDMFFRLSGKVDGSGIGLYIVKEIIEKLNGNISVSSVEGKGTTFLIRLKNYPI